MIQTNDLCKVFKRTIGDDIEKGEAGYIKDYLQEIVDQKEGTPENIEDAKKLIEKLDDFKPLAKI